MADYQVITSDFVHLTVSTSKDDVAFVKKSFAKSLTIAELKNKFELLAGAASGTMQLQLFTKDNKLVGALDNNDAMLGSYPVEDNMRVHIIDQFLLREQFANADDVPKFELPEEKYSERDDTVRQFMMKNKMGRFNAEAQQQQEIKEAREQELTEEVIVGARCQITIKDAPTKLGTIMFKGKVEGLPGYWVGVKYDEPLGKNDGTCKEKRYFECPPKYGAFVKAINVTMGDFPEEDYDLNEEL